MAKWVEKSYMCPWMHVLGHLQEMRTNFKHLSMLARPKETLFPNSHKSKTLSEIHETWNGVM